MAVYSKRNALRNEVERWPLRERILWDILEGRGVYAAYVSAAFFAFFVAYFFNASATAPMSELGFAVCVAGGAASIGMGVVLYRILGRELKRTLDSARAKIQADSNLISLADPSMRELEDWPIIDHALWNLIRACSFISINLPLLFIVPALYARRYPQPEGKSLPWEMVVIGIGLAIPILLALVICLDIIGRRVIERGRTRARMLIGKSRNYEDWPSFRHYEPSERLSMNSITVKTLGLIRQYRTNVAYILAGIFAISAFFWLHFWLDIRSSQGYGIFIFFLALYSVGPTSHLISHMIEKCTDMAFRFTERSYR